MTNVLIVLTLPAPVRMQYFNHLKQHFPGIKLDMVDHHSKVDPYIAAAEVLVTFGPHVANHVFEKAKNLKWVQAPPTGVHRLAGHPAPNNGDLATSTTRAQGGQKSTTPPHPTPALPRHLPRSPRHRA